MELRQIIEVVDRKPFVPFTIELDNGRKITVRHPENLIFFPNRAKLMSIHAYDDETDQAAMFGPSAVSAILMPRENGG